MRLCCVFALLLVCCSTSYAEDAVQPEPARIPVAKLKARVVDSEGNPIMGAKVVPWGVGSISGHGFWRIDEHGPVPIAESGKNGRLSLAYPLFHLRNVKSLAATISVGVSHPEFCRTDAHLSVESKEESLIALERGTKLSIGATRTGEESLLKDSWLLCFNDPSPESQWQSASGRIETVPLPDRDRWLYAVHFPESGPPLFSEPYEWNADDTESLHADLEVSPGSTLTGQLSANVPRPVHNGKVLFRCIALGLQEKPSLVWSSHGIIQSDGTFVVDQIPPGCEVQLLALCDGYVSAGPDATTQSRLKERYGELPTSAGLCIATMQPAEGLSEKIELGMVATAGLTVRVVDEDQRPLPGANIYLSPNQYWPGIGSQMLGDIPDSASRLRSKASGSLETMRIWFVPTNADGIARFEEVPSGDSTLEVVFPDGQSNSFEFQTNKELTITAKPRKQ